MKNASVKGQRAWACVMKFIASLVLGAVLVLGVPFALAVNVAVGSCKPKLQSFPTISAAVASVPAGTNVEICPGSYYEQVFINQSLTLEGISSGNSSEVVIYPPSSGLTSITDVQGYVLAPGIVVNAGPVNITNVTVDATGNLINGGSASCVGIFYNDGVSGTVNEVTARNQICGAFDAGIWSNSLTTTSTLTIENSNFHDIGNSSLVALESINLTVKNNTMRANFYNAQIVLAGNSVTITGNDIEGFSGLSLSGATGTVSANSIEGEYGIIENANSVSFAKNNISNSTYGIFLASSGATFVSNTITHTGTAIEFNCHTSTVSGNFVNDATIGFDSVPASFVGTNKFNSVATIRTDGCGNGPRKQGPGKPGVLLPAPAR